MKNNWTMIFMIYILVGGCNNDPPPGLHVELVPNSSASFSTYIISCGAGKDRKMKMSVSGERLAMKFEDKNGDKINDIVFNSETYKNRYLIVYYYPGMSIPLVEGGGYKVSIDYQKFE